MRTGGVGPPFAGNHSLLAGQSSCTVGVAGPAELEDDASNDVGSWQDGRVPRYALATSAEPTRARVRGRTAGLTFRRQLVQWRCPAALTAKFHTRSCRGGNARVPRR